MLGLHGSAVSPTDLSTTGLKKGTQCDRVIVYHHHPVSPPAPPPSTRQYPSLPAPPSPASAPPSTRQYPSLPAPTATCGGLKNSSNPEQAFDAIADKEIQDREEEQLGYLQEEINEIRKLIDDIKSRQAETRHMVAAFKGADYDLEAVFERARNWRHSRDDWSREYTPTPPPLMQSNLGASEKSFLEEMAEAEALETVQEEAEEEAADEEAADEEEVAAEATEEEAAVEETAEDTAAAAEEEVTKEES